jgi:methyl-accepting chemotaxis protein
VELVANGIQQMARSIQAVADNSEKITESAAAAATSTAALNQSIKSVAGLAKQTDEAARHVVHDAEQGGAAVQKTIEGFGKVRDSILQSAAVIRDMGKRTTDVSCR